MDMAADGYMLNVLLNAPEVNLIDFAHVQYDTKCIIYLHVGLR